MDDKPFDYDEPLDALLIAPGPDFRKVLRILNAAGVHTVSSCQGHPRILSRALLLASDGHRRADHREFRCDA